MKAFMYILQCSDNTYYVGSTKNLTLRIEEHNHGEGAEYTKHRLPVKLVYYEECFNIKDAFLREKQVQGWSRKKREALIKGEYDKLPELSKQKVVSTGSTTTTSDSTTTSSDSTTTSDTTAVVELVETSTSNSTAVVELVETTNIKE